LEQADIAIIGVGTMGSNLALNMAEQGAHVALYDLDAEKPRKLAAENFPGKLIPTADLAELVAAVRAPRPIVLLAPAGAVIDSLIDSLNPLLAAGDILIDAGNSAFRDTQRRVKGAEADARAFLGVGVSGGAKGARNGPAMMAGGSASAWARVAPVFEKIAAQHNGKPCAAWLGPDGAGHFVKSAHNGIEYALMQMIAECYGILRDGFGMSAPEIGAVFSDWNKGALDCYLVDITAKALKANDGESGGPLVDVILDRAGQKGTGLWTAVEAQRLGVPATTVEGALVGRSWSARRDERLTLERHYGPAPRRIADAGLDPQTMLREALVAGKIIAYSQGFALIHAASHDHGWDINLVDVAKVWRAGCIIRSRLLGEMTTALEMERVTTGSAVPLLLREPFMGMMKAADPSFRGTVATAAVYGLPVPALSSALNWFDLARTGRSTANLIQAQRDFFGAHGFERTDREGGGYHGAWA
jgi:6-phosphogluconate dehydrogenase